MPADRDRSSAADIVFTAVSPALIVMMVGSLVYFLITVLPTGEYKERLQYTTFFFVFGAVLVARIAIQVDAGRASIYGLCLALATFFAMNAFVEYPASTGLKSIGWLLNIGFMALIWFSAHKLTWDCTHVDENRDASGRGLLAASGLAESDTAKEAPEERAPEPPVSKKKKRKKNSAPKPSAFSSWTARWWAHYEKGKGKPHTPGVWVVYFSLAALPLFAIGQSLIPAEDEDRRRATFLQMAVYVGSGLGLLVTTSLLGLRRYLKQRKAKLSGSLTAGWLGLGASLIVFFLVVGAFLPRPYSEVPWFGLPQAGKSEREASKYAKLSDSAGKGEGADGEVTEKGNGKASGKNGEPGGNKGEKGSGGKGQGKGKSDSKGNSKGGDSKGSDAKSNDPANKGQDEEADKDKDEREGRTAENEREAKDAQGKGDRGKPTGKTPETKLGAAVQQVAKVFKWIVLAIVIFLVVVGIVLVLLKYLAPFTAWARNLLDALKNWWAGLFGRKTKARAAASAEADPRGQNRPPPFASYSNPFADGSAERRDAEELVEYTFEAFDSWAWDRGKGRLPAETPLEFAVRLGAELEDFDQAVRRMANLYARVAYAEGELPEATIAFLEQFWEQLVHGVNAPLAASR